MKPNREVRRTLPKRAAPARHAPLTVNNAAAPE
jgi:hypothetical protein